MRSLPLCPLLAFFVKTVIWKFLLLPHVFALNDTWNTPSTFDFGLQFFKHCELLLLNWFPPDPKSVRKDNSIPFFFFGPAWKSNKLTDVWCSFVRSSVTSFPRGWLISFFWFFAQWCKMAIPKIWRSPNFVKELGKLGQKLLHLFFLIFAER